MKITATGYPVEWIEETNYKFRFTSLKEQVNNYLTSNDPVKPRSLYDSLLTEVKNLNVNSSISS